MGMRMLIDATHLEETRVVVVKGTRLEEFDYETSTKQVLKGNIYLARVTRVEPSLQAAFVEYGGNRHGFLAFGEIHPDYYQIPIADRQALLAQQAEEEARAAQAEEEELEAAERAAAARAQRGAAAADDSDADGDDQTDGVETVEGDYDAVEEITSERPAIEAPSYWNVPTRAEAPIAAELTGEIAAEPEAPAAEAHAAEAPAAEASASSDLDIPAAPGSEAAGDVPGEAAGDATPAVEAAMPAEGGEAVEAAEAAPSDQKSDEAEEGRRPRRTNFYRRYKIQEVIKRRQIMLVQVVKEERGNKGAALTTYLSLAGRYCVLMPNTARGGGISRKIQSPADRKRLKAITSELDIPEGMGVIVRTAGMERSKPEIRRDFEYLLRSWDSIRERTLESTAPALIYEEADLIKRSIRDLYSSDIDEVLVEGDQGYAAAHDFMQMLMPAHADRVKMYQDKIPLFHRYQVEQQLDGMFSPTVQLRSGGYIVINPTEALVSIDINSGKSTREHNIEETAYKTNLEAAEEIARQLRLRDLAGLVVIDFIDMEDHRNIRNVERRLKECLRNDRARIQVGRISGFGLLEMSRQRLRPSLIESSTMPCPHCQGRGYVRSIESTALQVLRAIEEEGIRDRASEITVSVPAEVAIYLLNHKRERISDIERRYVMRVIVAADNSLVPPDYKIERVRPRQPGEVNRPEVAQREGPRPITQESSYAEANDADDGEGFDDGVEAEEANGESRDGEGRDGEGRGEGENGRRRRRRRRRRRGRDGEATGSEAGAEAFQDAEAVGEQDGEEAGLDDAGAEDAEGSEAAGDEANAAGQAEGDADGEPRRRRRGRRGGRRRRRGEEGQDQDGRGEEGRGEDGGEGGSSVAEAADGEPKAAAPVQSRRPSYPQREEGFLTPAALGAMLDGRPSFEFDEDEPQPAKPAPAPVAAPVAVAPVAAPAVEAAPVVAAQPEAIAVAAQPEAVAEEPQPAAEPAPPPTPVHTQPVFESNGDAPPTPKRGWWSR